MNEEALQRFYELFQADGYGDSFEDFRQLMLQNEEAQRAAYELALGDGYGDYFDDFKVLVGAKESEEELQRTRDEQRKMEERDAMEALLLKKKRDAESSLEGSSSESPTAKDYYKFMGPQSEEDKSEIGVQKGEGVMDLPTSTEAVQEIYTTDSGVTMPSKAIGIGFLSKEFPLSFEGADERTRLLLSKMPREELHRYETLLKDKNEAYQKIPNVKYTEVTPEYKNFQKLDNLTRKIEEDYLEAKVYDYGDPIKKQTLTKEEQQFTSDLAAYNKQLKEESRDFFEESVDEYITKDLISSEEEEVVSFLNNQFGDVGFGFEETGIMDAMIVTAPNGATKEIDLDTIMSDDEEKEKLKTFMKNNRPSEKIDKVKLQRYEDQEDLDEGLFEIENLNKNYIKASNQYDADEKKYYKELAAYTRMTPEQKDSEQGVLLRESLISQKKNVAKAKQKLELDKKNIASRKEDIYYLAGKYAEYLDDPNRGNLSGSLWNAFAQSWSSMTAGTVDLALWGAEKVFGKDELAPEQTDIYHSSQIRETLDPYWKKKYGYTWTDQLNKNADKGNYDYTAEQKEEADQIMQEFSPFSYSLVQKANLDKDGRAIIREVRKGSKLWEGPTSDKWTETFKEEQPWYLGGGGWLHGVVETLPAMPMMATGYKQGGSLFMKGARTLFSYKSMPMIAMSYDRNMQEMEKNPAFKNVSLDEKRGISTLLAVPEAALEKITWGSGLLNAKPQIGAWIAKKALAKKGSTLGTKAYQKAVVDVIENNLARGIVRTLSTGAAEFETGLAQEITSMSIKNFYDDAKGKKMFDNPQFFGGDMLEFTKQALKGGFYEMLGGIVMGVPAGVSTSMNKKDFSKMDDATWGIFKQIKDNPQLLKLTDQKFIQEISLGQMTPRQALMIKENYKEATNLYNEIPDAEKYTGDQQREIMGLLLRKHELQRRIDKKDKALSSKDKAEIETINQKLVNISERAGDINYTLEKIDDVYKNVKDDAEVELAAETLEEIPDIYKDRAVEKDTGDMGEVEIGSTITGLSIGKQKTPYTGTYYTYKLTGKELNNAIQEQSTDFVDANQSAPNVQEMEGGTSETGPEVTTPKEGEQVSEEQQVQKEKLNNLGFTDEVIEMMTPEDIEVAQTYTEPSQATEMVERYQKDMEAAQSLAAEDTTTEDKPLTAEDVETVGVAGQVTQQNRGNLDVNPVQKKIIRQAEKAVQSLKKIMPNLRIITYATEAEYAAAVPKSKIGERGEISNDGNTIRINLAAADETTVSHEIFHAIITSKFNINSKKIATAVNNDLIKKLLKVLPKDKYRMNVVDKITKERKQISLHEYLEEYVKEYKDTETHSEEKLAQIFGFLGANYSTLTYQEQSVIKKFINKIKSLVGRQVKDAGFTKDDARVIDLLNSLAYKVKVGEEVQEGDLQLFDEVAEEVQGQPTETTTEEVVEETPAEEVVEEVVDEAPAETTIEEILEEVERNEKGVFTVLNDRATTRKRIIKRQSRDETWSETVYDIFLYPQGTKEDISKHPVVKGRRKKTYNDYNKYKKALQTQLNKKTTTEEAPAEEMVTDEEFTEFTNTGKVADEVIEKITEKIKRGEQLTQREEAIRQDKSNEVEAKLKETTEEAPAEEVVEEIDKKAEEVLNETKKFIESSKKRKLGVITIIKNGSFYDYDLRDDIENQLKKLTELAREVDEKYYADITRAEIELKKVYVKMHQDYLKRLQSPAGTIDDAITRGIINPIEKITRQKQLTANKSDNVFFAKQEIRDVKEEIESLNNLIKEVSEEAPTSRKQVAAKESVAPMKVNEEFSKMTPEQKRKQLGGRYGILSLELKKGLFFAEQQYKKRDEYDRLSKSNKLKDMDLFAKKFQGNPPMTEAQIFLNSGGWYRGIDGEYRYEIPDGKLAKGSYKDFTRASKDAATREARLDEVYIAPEVYKTYPFLKDIMVQFTAMTIEKDEETIPNRTTVGSWNPATKIIKFNTNYSEFAKATPEEQRNEIFYTIVHEVQHAIQDFEGFAMGGTDVETKGGLGKRVTEEFGKGRERLTKERIFASEAQKGLKKKYERFRINNEFIDYLSAALNKLKKLGEKDLYNKLLKSKNKGKDLVDIVLQYEATDATMNRIYREIKEDARYYNRELGYPEVKMTQKNLKEFFDNTDYNRHILDEYGINNAQTGSQIDAIQKSLLKRLRMYDAYKMYERTYGEIEARNVEERAKIKKELARYKSELDKLNRLGKKEVANEIFTKELYDYLSENVIDIEDVIGEGVTYEDFKIFLKNKSYSKEIYEYLTMKDPNYSRDVTLGEFQRNVEGLTTEEKIREIEEQLYKQLPTVTEDSKGLIEDIDKSEQGPYIMKSYPKAKRKQVASKQKVEMTTQEENAKAKEKLEGMNRKQLPSPNASMEDVIAWGRSRGESDAVLRMFLKSRGYGTIKEIREAMAQTVQMAAMPPDLANIEGGLEVAEKMYEDIMTKFYDATMETREVVAESKKRIAKAKRVMQNNPKEYGKEKDGVFTKPNGDKVTLDITKAKRGVKIITATQVLGAPRTSMESVFTKSKAQRRAILQQIIESNEDYQNQDEINKANIQRLLDRALNTRANPSVEQRMRDVKRIAKAAEQNEKKLQEVRNRLRALIRESIPRHLEDSTTTKNLNAMIKSLAKVNSTNVLVETDRILKQIERINKKEINSLRKKALKIIKQKSSTAKQGKTTGVDAETNMFMQEIKKIWLKMDELLKEENSGELIDEYLNKIQEELEDGKKVADIDTIIKKTIDGEPLNSQEKRKLYKNFAYDMMYTYPSLDYEGMQLLYEEIADLKAEGIAKFKSNREARVKRNAKLEAEAVEQLKLKYPFLVNENGEFMDNEEVQLKKAKLLNQWKKTRSFKAIKDWSRIVLNKKKQKSSEWLRAWLATNETLNNALDMQGVGKSFFTKNVYQRLRDMRDVFLKGQQSEQKKMNEILNGIPAIAEKVSRRKSPYAVLVDMLAEGDMVDIQGNIFTPDEALRIYALSKNEVQREKLQIGQDKKGRGTFITDAGLQELEAQLPTALKQYADAMVDYLSNDYYNSVNDVYMDVNSASLPYVENYFPTKTYNTTAERSSIEEKLQKGDVNFNAVFNAQTAPALNARTNVTGRIPLKGYTFTGELSNHFEQMERFKAYAEGVKVIRDIVSMDSVNSVLDVTGLKQVYLRNLMTTINPNAFQARGPESIFGKALNNFSSFVLGFKLWQIPKQATSFINAFEEYDSGLIKKDVDGLGLTKGAADMVMFMIDMAATTGSLAFELMPKALRERLGIPDGPISQAYKISPTFRNRIQAAMEGDLWGLESGSKIKYNNEAKSEGIIPRKLKMLPQKARKYGSYPTMLGDVLGVMGYMINYRRDIKNGMSKEEALRKFNRYEATQQTRSETEKNRLQLESNDMLRAFTMFGSTPYLQQNKIAQASANMMQAISRGKMPRKQDMRSLILNLGFANVAFIYMSNIFKYAFGDDEDKEEVMRHMKKVMLGFNSLTAIPYIGPTIKAMDNYYTTGKVWSQDLGVNPFMQVWNRFRKAYEGKLEFKNLPKDVISLIGINTDPFVALYNKTIGEGDFFEKDEDFYDLRGISKSYRPSESKYEEGFEPFEKTESFKTFKELEEENK